MYKEIFNKNLRKSSKTSFIKRVYKFVKAHAVLRQEAPKKTHFVSKNVLLPPAVPWVEI